jgi:hypothetical protein
MDAITARAQSTKVRNEAATKKSAELRKRRETLKKTVPRLRAERIKKIEAEFRERIEWAVEAGESQTEITLSSDYNDTLRGEHKYLPSRGKDSYYKAWGEDYLKYAAWGKYVKLVLAKLRRDKFTCVVEGKSIEHDESSAYLNSGGECGSETPYCTRDTILTISW